MLDRSEANTALVSIGLVADFHYAPITVGNRYCSESLTKLRAAVAELQTRELDLVVCLGDVIDESETIEAELGCVRQVVECLDALPAPKHFVLGNHDVSELTKEQFLEACGARAAYYFMLRAIVEGAGLEQNAYALLTLMKDGAIALEGFWQQPSLL